MPKYKNKKPLQTDFYYLPFKQLKKGTGRMPLIKVKKIADIILDFNLCNTCPYNTDMTCFLCLQTREPEQHKLVSQFLKRKRNYDGKIHKPRLYVYQANNIRLGRKCAWCDKEVGHKNPHRFTLTKDRQEKKFKYTDKTQYKLKVQKEINKIWRQFIYNKYYWALYFTDYRCYRCVDPTILSVTNEKLTPKTARCVLRSGMRENTRCLKSFGINAKELLGVKDTSNLGFVIV